MIRRLDLEKENMPTIFKGFEQDSKFIKVDLDYSDKTYRDLIGRGVGQIFLLFDDDTGDLVGGLGCIKAPDLHSGDMIAIETFWYVLPQCRNKMLGMELLFTFEQWAKEEGCTKVAMIHLADSAPESLEKLYLTMGYRLLEKHYIKEVQP